MDTGQVCEFLEREKKKTKNILLMVSKNKKLYLTSLSRKWLLSIYLYI